MHVLVLTLHTLHGPQGLNSDRKAEGQVPLPCVDCPKAPRLLSLIALRAQHRTGQKSLVIYRYIFNSNESSSLETREVIYRCSNLLTQDTGASIGTFPSDQSSDGFTDPGKQQNNQL